MSDRNKIRLPDIMNITGIVTKALRDEANKSSGTFTQTQAEQIAPSVSSKIETGVQPIIDHLTNQEPWYQSRVTWGAIIATVAGIAGLSGLTISSQDQAVWVENITQAMPLITAIASTVGGLIAWYGRWRAKKPIGE